MKKYEPNKVFVLEDGAYIEISYEELIESRKLNKDYECKWFIPLHGMLMEVPEDAYREFYREEERWKYIEKRTRENGDVSYEWLIESGFDYEMLLATPKDLIEETVEVRMMESNLQQALIQLSDEEKKLIRAVFVQDMSERKWAAICGIPQRKMNRKKIRILKSLRKRLEKL